MKWIFLAGLLFATPFLVVLLRQNANHLPKAAFALGLLFFFERGFNLGASPITWPTWQGTVKGIEISLTDAVAFAMILASSRLKTPLALKILLGLFVAAFAISTALAPMKMPALFYGWQIVRTVIVYLALARASVTHKDVPIALLTGLIAGLVIQAGVVANEYLGGAVQAGGWFGHQNLLGLSSHFIVYPALAAFLGGHYQKRSSFAVVAGIIIAFVGGSRATIGLLVIGMALTAAFSLWHRKTGKKIALAGSALVVMVAVAPLLYSAVERRPAEIRAGSAQMRDAMESAAAMIISDYPMGVGANRYVIVANLGGYAERAGVPWNVGNRAAPVHNTYYLVTAEMGWLGLIAFLSIIAYAILLAIRTFRATNSPFGGEYAVGISTALIIVAAHSAYEWVTMVHTIHVLFGMNIGILVALRSSCRHRNKRAVGKSAPMASDSAAAMAHAV